MSDPLRTMYIDRRIDSYGNYVPEDWGEAAFGRAEPAAALHHFLVDMLLAWRTTAYMAAMPATAIKVMQASLLGYASVESPDSSIVAYGEKALAVAAQQVPEVAENSGLRSRLMAAFATAAAGIRDAWAKVQPEMPLEPIWHDLLNQDAFQLTVWSSQRVCYVSFFNAYEAFLVQCAKHALGLDRLRSSDRDFNEKLRTAFGPDGLDQCWTRTDVLEVRRMRHALSHAGGRVTEDLKHHKHGIRVEGGVLQIVPDDNHRMLATLRASVDALIDFAVQGAEFASLTP